ncbi:YchJ family protein [Amycolatopsis minnesotensis]|uniref:YchJ family metal-binding protein n=1 Tax=Amycolatopsis minnesotensis TaxID=337894 RepID=A0ABN2S1I3_9PSEU
MTTPKRCPCGTGETYDDCCGPFHRGTAAAPTAEHLMRSRYSAFAVGDAGYLARTWSAKTRPKRLELDPDQRWTLLEILGRTGGGLLQAEGTVEFRAHYRLHGERGELRENSLFAREDGAWKYVRAR